jgi:hypothetical protein
LSRISILFKTFKDLCSTLSRLTKLEDDLMVKKCGFYPAFTGNSCLSVKPKSKSSVF